VTSSETRRSRESSSWLVKRVFCFRRVASAYRFRKVENSKVLYVCQALLDCRDALHTLVPSTTTVVRTVLYSTVRRRIPEFAVRV
jgi:hypothetical protein